MKRFRPQDTDLRRKVENLIEADEEAGDFMETPIVNLPWRSADLQELFKSAPDWQDGGWPLPGDPISRPRDRTPPGPLGEETERAGQVEVAPNHPGK